ncbi:hypothetical protein JW964_14835 [candidate division KSB1 bacterium]|nr:hypothetical protein [candidate division KSB1 bacterium]
MKKISFRFVIVSLIILSFVLVSCSEKDPVAPTESPVLPPAESMKIDVSFFQKSGLAKTSEMATKNNFLNASLRVAFVNTAVVLTMSIPTAVFAAAASTPPVWNDNDKKFHWIYTVNYNQLTFKADLAGSLDSQAGEAVWEMYITSNATKPTLDNFLWYEGRSKLGNKSGWWLIYDYTKPTEKKSVFRLDWSIKDTESTVVFKNVLAGNEGENDVLTYWANATERKVTYFDNSKQETAEVYWEIAKGTGYVLAPDYNNGQKACWDENQNDVACP